MLGRLRFVSSWPHDPWAAASSNFSPARPIGLRGACSSARPRPRPQPRPIRPRLRLQPPAAGPHRPPWHLPPRAPAARLDASRRPHAPPAVPRRLPQATRNCRAPPAGQVAIEDWRLAH
ncbi:hypothetical protein PVAP13_5NG009700 [Panicum virgatum]|uniref:Uncharacterized protein n=1 Tax=Panicum virgatum TaxID=38727 RepID=A0A8T0RKB2_PANVG|nr:hypothetical protein PVAP13_5NG009700 [Panicum virgatum]